MDDRYVVVGGRIQSPGKFEGEPEYVPTFWSLANEGGADWDAGNRIGFHIGPADTQEWPQLACHLGHWLYLEELENGFVVSVVSDVTPWELEPENVE